MNHHDQQIPWAKLPPATRCHRARRFLWVPGLALLVGCGTSPIALSVSGSQSSIATPIDSPLPVTASVESDEPIFSSSEVSSDATSRDVAAPSSDVTTPEPNRPSVPCDCKQLIGCWKDSFCGQRTLTLKTDGSATMHLELDFAGRLLYGKTLEFDMRWSLDESIVTFEIVAGRPVDAARSAMKLWGEAFEYRVELVDGERLHAWASDDSTLYKLRRGSDENVSSGQ